MSNWQTKFLDGSSRFPLEIVEELLEQLRDGRSMRDICSDPRMPDRETVRRWCDEDADLNAAITHAREIGWYDRAERAVVEAKQAPDPVRGRLGFDAERWFLGKVSKIFSDNKSKAIELTGANGAPLAVRDVSGMSAREIAEEYRREIGE
jgi:hypothetical protein